MIQSNVETWLLNSHLLILFWILPWTQHDTSSYIAQTYIPRDVSYAASLCADYFSTIALRVIQMEFSIARLKFK